MCECSTIIVMVVIHWLVCSVITHHPLCKNCQGHVGWLIKNRGRHAPAFPGGVADSEARPAPHPIVETTNGPLRGSAVPGASHQSDPGPLAWMAIPTLVIRHNPAEPTTKTIEQLEWMHSISLRRSRLQAVGMGDPAASPSYGGGAC